jgi:hypothetical protein
LELNDEGDSKFAESEEMIVDLKAEFAVSFAENFAEYLWNYEIFWELWMIAVDTDDDRRLLQKNKPFKIYFTELLIHVLVSYGFLKMTLKYTHSWYVSI